MARPSRGGSACPAARDWQVIAVGLGEPRVGVTGDRLSPGQLPAVGAFQPVRQAAQGVADGVDRGG
jgi:hypothetical protein